MFLVQVGLGRLLIFNFLTIKKEVMLSLVLTPQQTHWERRHPELTDVQVPDLPGSLECAKF